MNLIKLFSILEARTKKVPPPASELMVQQYGRDPFLLLMFCILSLRTRDAVSVTAAHRLFAVAKTPQAVSALPIKQIESLIYPVGFYRRKAIQIQACAQIIAETYNGKTPNTEHALLALPGVGRKTMNLVLQEGFLRTAFCVDTHVHRIANKLGLVKTKTPTETESALKKLIPQEKWRVWNHVLLVWGQHICKPSKHACSTSAEEHK